MTSHHHHYHSLLVAIENGDLNTLTNDWLPRCNLWVEKSIHEKGYYATTPLIHAIECHQLPVVQFLVEQCGANVNGSDGWVPLVEACGEGQLDICQYLVQEAKANVNIVGGNTPPLLVACELKEWHVVQYFVQTAAKVATACGTGGDAAININVNLPHPEASQQTALMLCCQHGKLDLVKCLVEQAKANLELQDDDGWTALMYAIEYEQWKVAQYLVVQCGAKVVDSPGGGSCTGYDGATPLTCAIEKGQLDLVQCMVKQHGLGILGTHNRVGQTPLFAAVKAACQSINKDSQNMVSYLLSQGANVEACDHENLTPIQFAAKQRGPGHHTTVHLLLQYQIAVQPFLVSSTGGGIAVAGGIARAHGRDKQDKVLLPRNKQQQHEEEDKVLLPRKKKHRIG